MRNTLFFLSCQAAIPPLWHFLFALALSNAPLTDLTHQFAITGRKIFEESVELKSFTLHLVIGS